MKKWLPQRQIKRVGIYNRVSTEEQVNGYSLDMRVITILMNDAGPACLYPRLRLLLSLCRDA
ncbi:MAG: hypothetical protein M1136_02580 [Chloroflexi bacterium]|nr:hypothetical protein [Chloroflexota bacterium]MCL5074525.1 hypothetical protein [Chloroflexota bacterium]